MAANDISAWLRELGLERYCDAFHTNDIDFEVLSDLSEPDLERLGVSLGHRKKILKAIASLAVADVAGSTEAKQAIRPAAGGDHQAERRQVTVLFCDLAGYTALTRDLGAETMHALISRFFERVDGIIEGYGGTIDKHIGDCVMAVFGAPQARGNDAERAIRAALEIHAAVPGLGQELGREIRAHIGIASGQVVASGAAGDRSYSITGDSVNLASRLTDAAEPGAILIAEGVRAALAERLECTAVDQLTVKGFAEPVTAWRLEGLRAPAGASDRPFVGRRAELAQFEAILQACLESETGHAIHLRGEAGIGKTRLVEEFQRRAAAVGFSAHTGLVLDFGAGTGQDAIRALMRSLLRQATSDAPAAAQGAVERALRAGLLAHEQRVHLNDLLDLPQPTELRSLYDAMDNATRNRGKRQTVASLVRNFSRQQPLLLVVEDVHWADRLTLEHLATLAETVADCPTLLVMTSRIEGDPIDPAWRSSVPDGPLMTIDLGPLRSHEATALAGVYLDATADFARRCIERAAGNPLFLEQLLRHAEESSTSGVPGSVQSLVQARLDQLEPPDRRALQAASVFGQRFAREALRHLIDDPDYACGPLVRRLLIRPAGNDFLFAHALIRDAVYDSLLWGRRRELHLRAAAWFADRDLVLRAEHIDRAEDPGAPQAYLAAARAEAAGYHYDRARALTERGLAIAADPASRFDLTWFLGEILHDLGAMAESRAAYERALADASDDHQRVSAWIGLAAVKRVTDDIDGAFTDLDRAQAIAERLDLAPQQARIHSLRGNLHFPRGEIEGCLAEHQKSLDVARRIGSPELEAQALGGLGDAEYVRGRMKTAFERFRESVALCREHGLGRIEVANFSMFGHTQLYLRPQRQALADALAAAEAAAWVGHRRAELNARLAVFFALCELGEYTRLHAEIRACEALVEGLGAKRFLQPCLLFLGKALLLEGRREESVDRLHEALAVSRETGLGFQGPNILGALALAVQDSEERRCLLTEAEGHIRRGCVAHNQLRFYPAAIQTSLELGDWSEAERYADALEAFTRPEPLPWSDLFIARGRVLAAIGRGRRDDPTRLQLGGLLNQTRRLELLTALPAMERALAGF